MKEPSPYKAEDVRVTFKFFRVPILFSKMNFLKPDYNGGSISNIYGSILKNFDLNSDRKPLRKSFEKSKIRLNQKLIKKQKFINYVVNYN